MGGRAVNRECGGGMPTDPDFGYASGRVAPRPSTGGIGPRELNPAAGFPGFGTASDQEGPMLLQQFEAKGLAHYSYAIGCSRAGRIAVVDPKRDVDDYLRYAGANGLTIAHVLETHIHADYASGAVELARRTGARLSVSSYDRGETYEAAFAHHDLRDGDWIELGGVRLRAVHTPGHTPEHLSYLAFEEGSDTPAALLSGDFLFVGSLGRPDLLGEDAKARLASQLFDSVREKLGGLPDSLAVYPAHGAGSMCGAGMGSAPSSTLRSERASNPYLDPNLTREQFVARILASVPPFPPYYRRMKQLNAAGATPLPSALGGRELAAAEFRRLVDEGHVVIDTRGQLPFGAGHVPKSLGIGLGDLLSTWAAWTVPYDTPLLLVTARPDDAAAAARCLARVGLDDVRGCLAGGFEAWREAGYPVSETPQLTPAEAYDGVRAGRVRLVDVRGDGEWAGGHAPGAVHIMGGFLAERADSLRGFEGQIAVTCGGGYRSTVGASVLERAGFSNVANVTDGMRAWRAAGLPVE